MDEKADELVAQSAAIVEDGGQSIIDPEVQEFEELLAKRIGDVVPCPVCGTTTWLRYRRSILALAPVPEAAEGREVPAKLRSVAFSCAHCHFLRCHVLAESGDKDATP